MGLDCISTVVKIGVRMIQNATKWKEFLSLGTGGGEDSVRSKFGQSVSVFLLMWICLGILLSASGYTKHHLSCIFQIIMRKRLSVQIVIIQTNKQNYINGYETSVNVQ
jgi:hypothetical protein